ncbi:MAG: WD40 repeat domain-containing protein [Anaerolineae bacterium]|nr:WD40 repeat domain-containing protein [Anaerolineae bacterium]
MPNQHYIRELKKRRLQKLKQQAALSGISTDPKILIEIEDIEKELEEFDIQLRKSPSPESLSHPGNSTKSLPHRYREPHPKLSNPSFPNCIWTSFISILFMILITIVCITIYVARTAFIPPSLTSSTSEELSTPVLPTNSSHLLPIPTPTSTIVPTIVLIKSDEVIKPTPLTTIEPPQSKNKANTSFITKMLCCHEGLTSRITSVRFSPDGTQVLTTSEDNSVRLWDVETATEIRRFYGHSRDVLSAAFSPDGKTIVSASGSPFNITNEPNNTVRLWNTDTGVEIRRFEGHLEKVNSVDFSPDGQTIVTGSDDLTIRLWNVNSGQEIKRFDDIGIVKAVTFSPDGQKIASISWDTNVRIWDVVSGKEIHHFESMNLPKTVDFSSDGQRIVTVDNGGINVWNVETGAKLLEIAATLWDIVYSAEFSPDGQAILSANHWGYVYLWDSKTGDELRRFSHSSDNNFTTATFSPDGQIIAVGMGNGGVRLWAVTQ